jgi:hypothetical protein
MTGLPTTWRMTTIKAPCAQRVICVDCARSCVSTRVTCAMPLSRKGRVAVPATLTFATFVQFLQGLLIFWSLPPNLPLPSPSLLRQSPLPPHCHRFSQKCPPLPVASTPSTLVQPRPRSNELIHSLRPAGLSPPWPQTMPDQHFMQFLPSCLLLLLLPTPWIQPMPRLTHTLSLQFLPHCWTPMLSRECPG